MTRFGLDSTGEVPAWAHHAVGSSVALRYLSRSTAKVITHSEHERYRAAGIDLVLVFEDSGRPDRQGYDGGKADAEFALRQALGILGTPARAPRIRFAADYDPAGHPEATDAYFDGVAAVFDRVRSGPYGSDEMVAHHARRGFQTLWQTYGWSGGRFFSSPFNSAYQYSNDHTVGGVGVDFNHLYGADFGQWDFRAVAADPHHYARFPTGTGTPDERTTVLRYDGARQHPLRYARLLAGLRGDLKALADRVYFAAHQDRPASWGAHWRGWRYQELIHRAQGARLA